MTVTQKAQLDKLLAELLVTYEDMVSVNPRIRPIKDTTFFKWRSSMEKTIASFREFLAPFEAYKQNFAKAETKNKEKTKVESKQDSPDIASVTSMPE